MRFSIAPSPKSGRPVTPAASSNGRMSSKRTNCGPTDRIILGLVTAVESDFVLRQAFVDGRWVDADDGATFPVLDPATGETIAEVPRLGAAETRRAL